MRRHEHKRRSLGDAGFIEHLEKSLHQPLHAQKPGPKRGDKYCVPGIPSGTKWKRTWFAKSIPASEYSGELPAYPFDYNGSLWYIITNISGFLNGLRSSDKFDNVAIYLEPGSDVNIHQIAIGLNNEASINRAYPTIIMNKTWDDGPKTVIGGSTLNLSGYINDWRKNRILYQFGIRKNRILETAANDWGQAWSNKYPAYWDGTVKLWHHSPRSWCTEFTCSVLRTATGEPVGIVNNIYPTGYGALVDYFKSRDRYICLSRGFRYEDLGLIVLPGFPVKVNGFHPEGHVTIFISWVDGFDPGKGINEFWGIGGNQPAMVTYDRFKITKGDLDPNIDNGIVWREGRNQNGEVEDGFGIIL